MPTVKSTMDASEVAQTIGISLPTLYRWLAESRKGIGTLPLPIDTGGRKRRLIWNRDSILAFLENGNPPPPNVMSVAERQKRNSDACQSLQTMGVKIANSK